MGGNPTGARHVVIFYCLEDSLTTGSSLLPLLPSDVLLSEAQELGEGSRFSAEDRMTRCIILFFFFKGSLLHKKHVSSVSVPVCLSDQN